MTLQEFFDILAANPAPVLIYFILLPVAAAIAGSLTTREEARQNPWKYFYSALVYMSSVPGIMALVLCVYTLFFERQRSLLEVNALVYFLPIIVMIATLLLINRKADMRHIPGFRRLSGLLMMLAVTFIAILIIQQTRIWVVFHGSVVYLFGLFIVLFVAFYLGWNKLFSPSDEDDSDKGTTYRVD
ncbi:hypothetical protein C7N43_23050 [Sphingobacteriales bacterium UPWRP_1]|nr:hypothetical protein B6N25_05840 [Sphingobacteriales bacterium TSM_CSS]PSJ74628.1 hypothetical protein C7N43_23050 [Sphingobacteriales bacterium UPWRP_1]